MKTLSYIIAAINLVAAAVMMTGEPAILAATCYAFCSIVWFAMARS